MSHYRTGTAAYTNNSAIVTGTGTDWISGAAPGECIKTPDGKLVEILSIQAATQLTMGENYLGATESGQAYSIVPTQSYIRDLASQAATLVNGYSDVQAQAIRKDAADKATIVDADKLGGRDSVSGLAKLFSFSTIKTALLTSFKDASDGLAGLTLFKLNLRNAANTFTSFLTNAATAARTWTMPDKDGTLALLSDLTYKTQTGSVTITQAASNEMVRTHASASVVLPIAYLDAGYQVVAEIESAAPFSGSAGLLLVSNRATNGFTLSMTGSATSATLRWKTLHPNA